MDVTRKEFLKFSGITTAGSFLGGVTFLNGCKSIPKKLKGTTECTAICPFCSVGCGLIIAAKGNKIINIEGDPDHPINQGSLCAKGNALFQVSSNQKRLKNVKYRAPNSRQWKEISWEKALKKIAERIKKTRDSTFIEKEGKFTVNRTNGIAALGGAALDNEECYLWKNLAVILGISYIEDQTRNCHSASLTGLTNTFGRGAMTNHWIDFQHSDVTMIIGSNPAENHPVSYKYITKSIENGGKLISIDPRYTRSSALADIYTPIRPGTDIAFINGIMNYAIQNDRIQREYLVEYTNAAVLIRPGYRFSDGLFNGYNAQQRKYDKESWKYQLDGKGIPKMDKTLKNRRTVFQYLKKHLRKYTPELVSSVTGCQVDTFIKTAELFTSTYKPDKAGNILYSRGATQHTLGTQNVRSFAMLQLLLGNIGIPGGGLNALRGESNAQGSTDHGILWDLLPGYLSVPKAKEHPTLRDYINKTTQRSNDPMSINDWKHSGRYFINLLKAYFGNIAIKENDFCYDWLPKAGKEYPHTVLFEDMYKGLHKGAIIMGTNPIISGPNANMTARALEKLDWMVCTDTFETDTSIFWKRPGIKPEKIKTEVFLLPAAASFEKEGSLTNSGRWCQWKYKAAGPPGEAKNNLWIIDKIFREVKDLYIKERKSKFPDPLINSQWDFNNESGDPCPHKVAKEINGFNLLTKELVNNNTELKDDGSTACGNWLYCGSYTEDGNMMARREKKDASNDLGLYPEWSWSWPMNTRILYNRASVNRKGEPWNSNKQLMEWDSSSWTGDVVDGGEKFSPSLKNPFTMLKEGIGRIFTLDLKDGPLPEHYEPIESPVKNIVNNQNINPAVNIWASRRIKTLGKASIYPYVATTFQVAEHWQSGSTTRNTTWLIELVPDMYCEISAGLAELKSIKNGDRVKIYSARGAISAYALVTDRIRALEINGRPVEIIGIPWHFGHGCSASGDSCNQLTPHVGDANTMIPETKAFLVNIRKEV